ncbi:glycosyltransferase [Synechococcales cyanobacterium C]|uniref:Glycosyltransferase n=1 Tax=Petrachloros mirabilis ULC683 TaxID=2781853 RepID=A0A8K2A859_9CYAN|nr:glycosyltransferase family 2 protein [Petrachloros mirabilis]NCJ07641.1 glycosyltransferase [Petrachloros mirabilis ULC683]
MLLEQITPLVLTFNEAANIKRTISRLFWASQIIVVDSLSTDETLELIKEDSRIQVYLRNFDTHANQWNFGIQQVRTHWVLSLDADYWLSDQLIAELSELDPSNTVDGYYIHFRYCVMGKPLRGTLLPPRQALFRKDMSQYYDDGHTQLLQVIGQSSYLRSPMFHDDRKPLSDWLRAQRRYMVLESVKLSNTSASQLNIGDKVRKTKILAPFAVLFYCLFFKGGLFDGWHGWYYAFQRMLAEVILSLHLIEKELKHDESI